MTSPGDPDRGVLDTNALILLERISNLTDLPRESVITGVTLGELSVGPLVTTDPVERAARQARLQQAEADCDPLPFDAAAVRSFGGVAAALHRSGRTPHARAYDAMIAAMANSLPLYTCNPVDFASIDQLDLRGVPHPDRAGD